MAALRGFADVGGRVLFAFTRGLSPSWPCSRANAQSSKCLATAGAPPSSMRHPRVVRVAGSKSNRHQRRMCRSRAPHAAES